MSTQGQTGAKSVVVCDTQPVCIEGLRVLLQPCPDLKFSGGVCGILPAMELVNSTKPAVVLVDKTVGVQAICDWLTVVRNTKTVMVVWGTAISNSEALRLVQAGARGVVHKTSDLEAILSCLRTAAGGATWMSDTIFQLPEREQHRSNLTAREHQVAELVERGMRNKDIGQNLGIQTGTVKIHLKHIFEKTGCRGRFGLALSGLRDKGQLNLAVM